MEIDRIIPVVLRKGTFFNFILVYSMESIQNQTKRNKNYISEVGILKIEHSDFEVIPYFSTIETKQKNTKSL